MPRRASTGIPRYQGEVILLPNSAVGIPDTYRPRVQNTGLADVGKAIAEAGHVFETMADRREKRNLRDAEVQIDTLIRQRKLDVFSSRQSRAADNITQDETAWQAEQRETFVKNSKLLPKVAAQLWDQKMSGYLDRVSAFELEQGFVADKDSKFAAVVNAQSELATSTPGDFKAYAAYSAKVNELYHPQSDEAIKAKEKGLDVLIDTWAERNPQGTMQWFKANKEALLPVLGREFADISKAMARVQARLDATARRAEVQEARNIRLAEHAQKVKDNKWESDIITRILTDDASLDIREVVRDGQAKGISGHSLLTAQKVFESRESVSLKESSGAVRAEFQGRATLNGLSEEDRKSMTMLLADRKISPADYQAIMSADARTQNADSQGLKELRKNALAYLRTAIAPRGGLDQVNQAAETKFNLLSREVDKYVEQLSSINDKRVALDISSPNSFISQLVKSNAEGVKPIDRMKDALGTGGYNPRPNVVLPNVTEQRLPGETPEQWRTRISKGKK